MVRGTKQGEVEDGGELNKKRDYVYVRYVLGGGFQARRKQTSSHALNDFNVLVLLFSACSMNA